jgi:hypothetical protein
MEHPLLLLPPQLAANMFLLASVELKEGLGWEIPCRTVVEMTPRQSGHFALQPFLFYFYYFKEFSRHHHFLRTILAMNFFMLCQKRNN